MWRPPSAPVAQLDRAPDYESGGQRFESFRARHFPDDLLMMVHRDAVDRAFGSWGKDLIPWRLMF